jgi:hypothetical protein
MTMGAKARPPQPGEISKRALFELVGYQPHPGQVLVHRSKAKRRVVVSGVRWGKSTVGAMEAVAGLLLPGAEARGWVVAPTYELANQIFRRVAVAIERHFKHRVLELELREQRLAVLNLGGGRSELRAKSADNAVSLLGEGLDFVIIDEAARLKREVWEEHLAQRLIDKNGWALLLSTPQGPGWFYRAYRRGQRGRDPEWVSWSSPSWENPHLDRDVIEAERARLLPDAFEQEFGAKFVGVEQEPCEACGCPDPRAPGVLVIEKGEEMPKCELCGMLVGPAGHTLVQRLPGGGRSMLVLVLG